MYQHILVPIDSSADARREADTVARYLTSTDGARVTMAASITPSADPANRLTKVRNAHLALNVIGDILTKYGMPSRRIVLEGEDAADALAAEACSVDEQYDLFVLGVHQTHREIGTLPGAGSFADRLAQCSHLPVMILPGQA